MIKEIKYDAAFEELQLLVREMEDGEIGVDELSDKVKRAAKLINICKARLAQTEEDVKQILLELDTNGDESGKN